MYPWTLLLILLGISPVLGVYKGRVVTKCVRPGKTKLIFCFLLLKRFKINQIMNNIQIKQSVFN